MLESVNNRSIMMQQSFFGDTQKLAALKKDKHSPESLVEVAKQFEALFIQMALKSMRDANTAMDSELFSSQAKDTYQQMYDQQLSLHLAQEGQMGLADMLVKQMQPFLANGKEDDDTVLTTQQVNPTVKNNILPGEKIALFENSKQFVQEIWPFVNNMSEKYNLDPKLLLSQIALETNWGQQIIGDKDSSSYNLFNMPVTSAWSKESYTIPVAEFSDNLVKRKYAQFKSYSSFQDSCNDYGDFLTDNMLSINNKEPKQFLDELQTIAYTTDPNYTAKVLQIYNGPTLNESMSYLDETRRRLYK